MTCSCSQCAGVEKEFGPKVARTQLRRYKKRGPKRTTRWLIEAIRERRLEGASLLDIGGGVGEIQHELAEDGLAKVTAVDASSAYLEQCAAEANRRGYADRAEHHFGNFADLHEQVDSADVVTLDRVICCFDDVDTLVSRSVGKANRLYGLVYPRETWWTALGFRLVNIVQRLRRADFFVFLHPTTHVESLIAVQGLERVYLRESFLWQVALFEVRTA